MKSLKKLTHEYVSQISKDAKVEKDLEYYGKKNAKFDIKEMSEDLC